MKKIFAFAAMAATLVSFASCNKGGEENGGKGGDETFVKEYRITSLDGNEFKYDAQGRVIYYGNEEESREFTYNGTKLTITNNYKGDKTTEYTATLDAAGRAIEIKTTEHTWANTFDKNGYLVKVVKDGVERTNQTIEDGNIMAWGRWDGDNNFWRQKKATYLDKKNLGGVQTHWDEDADMKRWMWEAGFMGNTSVNVLESCRWWNFGDEPAPKTAVYEYEYDANGCITKETKYYGVWNETDLTGLDFDDEHTFTFEKIKK